MPAQTASLFRPSPTGRSGGRSKPRRLKWFWAGRKSNLDGAAESIPGPDHPEAGPGVVSERTCASPPQVPEFLAG